MTEAPTGPAVVTGGISGLGRGIAVGLARRGYRTIVVGRDPARVATATQEIAREAGGARIEGIAVSDLAVRGEMRALADRLTREYPDVTVLVNNAGGMFAPRQTTSDGLERTFALNVLAPFVLTERVGAAMRAHGGGRIVQVASAAHRGAHVPFDDLQNAHRYTGWRAYSRSKLEVILLAREFARRWNGSGVTVNAVHPGFVRSHFGQNNGRIAAAMVRFAARLGGRSIARGADTPVFVAADPTVAGVTGAYFADREVRPGSTASRDLSAARRLFDTCAELEAVG